MHIRDILIPGRSAKLPGDYAPQDADRKAKLRARGRVRKRKGEMNEQEKAFAANLQVEQFRGRVEWWGFEAITLRLADRTAWTPDFAVLY